MTGNTGSTVECPICGDEFDPREAGGWCTNPECGEWQYDGEDGPEGSTEGSGADDASGDTPDAGGGDGRTFPQGWAQLDEGGVDDASATLDTDETDELAEMSDDTDEIDPAERASGESDDTDEIDPAERASGKSGSAATGNLVELEAGELGGEPADEASDDGDDPSEPEGDEQESEPELTACPSCGVDVDPGDNFCVSCGEALLAHQDEEVLRECPSCGADVDPDDSFCVSCGEDLDVHRGGDGGGTAPGTLLLATRGEEIAVTDGDTVGRELRNVIMTTGGDEDQAVRVHREHIRFVREDGQFYMIDLGKNPTRLNGYPLEKGDRKPVSPGDEIELSGVLGLVIREP